MIEIVLPLKGLTNEQHETRRKCVGCSDLYKLMRGEWLELWELKTGRRQPEDLSEILRVQMGLYTEPFNRAWFSKVSGQAVRNPGKDYRHPVVPLAWTADGLTSDPEGGTDDIPWEGKHCGHYDTIEGAAETYYAQLQGQMEVMGASAAVLSVLFGNARHDWIRVKYDADYVTKILKVVERFWSYVENDQEPVPMDAVLPPSILAERIYDLSQSNEFTAFAVDWVDHVVAAKKCKAAEEGMKSLMPEDAAFAYHALGLCIVRAKNGNLSLREPNKKDLERIRKHQGIR